VAAPDRGQPEAAPAHAETRAEAIARVQRCFAELGYYKGPIDGKANEETWTAHWYFKHDHGLKAHADFLALPVREKLALLCKASEEAEAEPAALPEAGKEGATAAIEGEDIEPIEPKISLDIDCLPKDLPRPQQRGLVQ
jgi:hypothetical protein